MRKIIISFFERGIFLYQDNVFKTKEEESEEERIKKFIKYIDNESKSINYDLFITSILILMYLVL